MKLGNLPLPSYLSADQVIRDATDEIDSYIGMRYETPVDISDSSTVIRPARLLLKRICASLASGRLILALSGGEELRQIHAYGATLVKESVEALVSIRDGVINLEGATPAANAADGVTSGPLSYNQDPDSLVESFYNAYSLDTPTPYPG